MKRKIIIACIIAVVITTVIVLATACNQTSSKTNSSTQATEVVTDEYGRELTPTSAPTDENGNVVTSPPTKKPTDPQPTEVVTDEYGRELAPTSAPVDENGNIVTDPPTKKPTDPPATKPGEVAPTDAPSDEYGNVNTDPPTKKPTTPPATTPNKPQTETPTSAPTNFEDQKQWYAAEYKTVHHDAVYEKVWVVDKKSYTYEEPVYETVYGVWCSTTGKNLTNLSQKELTAYIKELTLSGEATGGFWTGNKDIQTGTKTVTVPEEGHWEDKLVKAAWTEKVLVREAGYY